MSTITKDKNMLYFVCDGGQHWNIDLNNGNMFGTSGKQIKAIPKYGKDMLQAYKGITESESDLPTILAHCLAIGNDNILPYMQFIESMYNANNLHYNFVFVPRGIDNHIQDNKFIKNMVSIATKTFEPTEMLYDYSDLYAVALQEYFLKEYGSLAKRYSEEQIKYAERYSHADGNIERLTMFLYYRFNDNIVQTLINNEWITEKCINSHIRLVLDMCEEMNIKPHKASIITEYQVICADYKAWKNKKYNEVFAATQNPAFGFTDGKYTAFVPTTIEECVQEGQVMRNCVGGFWLSHYGNRPDKQFIRGVVFIRDNKTQKSVATCDFTLDDMQIQQYLGECNSTIRKKALLQFRKELQSHLSQFVN